METNQKENQSCQLYKEVKQFVISVRTSALKDQYYTGASNKAMTRLVIQISSRLVDSKNRKHVLQALTGLPIMSQRVLTSHYHSVLIKETMEDSCLDKFWTE